MACNVQLNDGILFTIRTLDCNKSVKDISGATNLKIGFERPDKTSFTENANFETDGTDGKLQAVASGDVCGQWLLQGSMTLSGKPLHTKTGRFKVSENI